MRTAARTLSTALAAVLVAVAVSGCSLQQLEDLIPRGESRDDSGAITEGGTTDVFTLRAGDCLDDEALMSSEDDTERMVTEVPTVSCAEPHDFEVYENVQLPGDEYPGSDPLDEQIDQLCHAAFERFVAFSYDESIYDYTYYSPTAESWTTGDRTANCLIADPAGKTTGTLAGIGR